MTILPYIQGRALLTESLSSPERYFTSLCLCSLGSSTVRWVLRHFWCPTVMSYALYWISVCLLFYGKTSFYIILWLLFSIANSAYRYRHMDDFLHCHNLCYNCNNLSCIHAWTLKSDTLTWLGEILGACIFRKLWPIITGEYNNIHEQWLAKSEKRSGRVKLTKPNSRDWLCSR